MSIVKPQITNETIIKWFTDRKLEVLEYQIETIKKINDSLFKQELPTVAAASPSSGKSLMTIAFLDFYTKLNPLAKVLVLTHGTSILRGQFYGNINEASPSFTFKAVDQKQKDFDAQVIVTLPQTLNHLKILPKFDLLVVDEAHHFYFAEGKGRKTGDIGTVASIIKKSKPKHQLLLSGTPSVFIRKNYPIIPVTIEELLKADRVTDVIVELATSTYNLNTDDFNNEFELKEAMARAKITRRNTNVTMDDLLSHVLKRLTSTVKNNPKAYANLSSVSKFFTGKTWNDALSALRKTIIACNNADQAGFVKDYLEKKKLNVALSTAKTDIDSLEIDRFMKEDDCLVLIVIRRGILGYNLPELENVIDLTCSYNPDTIFQLMGRVLRKHPKRKQKLFFKVVPAHLSNLYRAVMQVVALLSNEKYYTTFDGKNMMDARLFAEVEVDEKSRKKKTLINKKKPSKTTTTPIKYAPIKFEGVPFFKLFNDLVHEDNAVLNGIAYVTLRQVIDRIKGYHTTIDEVIAELDAIHNG